jgi:hypothetical protein
MGLSIGKRSAGPGVAASGKRRRFPRSQGKPTSIVGQHRSNNATFRRAVRFSATKQGCIMNAIIYLVGLVVVVMFILSFLGLR